MFDICNLTLYSQSQIVNQEVAQMKAINFADLRKSHPEIVRGHFSRLEEMTNMRAVELGIELMKLEGRLSDINTVGGFRTRVSMIRESGDISVADILEYPLPILSDKKFKREDGHPNWRELKGIQKCLQYQVRLPLTAETVISYEVVQAFISIIMSPDYGRGIDLEAKSTFADATRNRPLTSYSRALLYLRRLAWMKGKAQYMT